jgi:hypothetical protein
MSNLQKPASAIPKEKKLLLFPGDPLIKVLKPEYYIIVDPGTLQVVASSFPDASEGLFGDPDDPKNEPDDIFVNELKAPSLSDITLVSKTMITDNNKNQFVEFVFNVKNSGGDTVVGVEAIGQ